MLLVWDRQPLESLDQVPEVRRCPRFGGMEPGKVRNILFYERVLLEQRQQSWPDVRKPLVLFIPVPIDLDSTVVAFGKPPGDSITVTAVERCAGDAGILNIVKTGFVYPGCQDLRDPRLKSRKKPTGKLKKSAVRRISANKQQEFMKSD